MTFGQETVAGSALLTNSLGCRVVAVAGGKESHRPMRRLLQFHRGRVEAVDEEERENIFPLGS